MFVRIADNKEALLFLRQVINRENLASHSLQGDFVVVQGRLEGDRITYPFYLHPTLEDRIRDAVLQGDPHLGTEYLEEYVKRIDRLCFNTPCIPLGFFQELGESDIFARPVRCLTFAPIDFLPSNILVDGNVWYVVDHEWTFDFPLPRDFLLYRAMCSLGEHLREGLRPPRVPRESVVPLSGYFRKKTFVPLRWLGLLRPCEVPLGLLARWNWLFLRKILRKWHPTRLRLRQGAIDTCWQRTDEEHS